MAPAGAGNGAATAAMIVGIVSLVLCFLFLGGVIAVVLGVIGLSKARSRGGAKKGQAAAGLIMGVVSLALGAGSWVLFVVAVNEGSDAIADATDELGGPADSSTYKVDITTCALDRSGTATVSGTIRNTSSRERNFEVEAEFRRSGTVLETGSTIVFDLGQGESQTWEVVSVIDSGRAVDCNVTDVNNFLN